MEERGVTQRVVVRSEDSPWLACADVVAYRPRRPPSPEVIASIDDQRAGLRLGPVLVRHAQQLICGPGQQHTTDSEAEPIDGFACCWTATESGDRRGLARCRRWSWSLASMK